MLNLCWGEAVILYFFDDNVDSNVNIEIRKKVNERQRWIDTIKKSYHYELYQRNPFSATTPEPQSDGHRSLYQWNKKIQNFVYSKNNVITKEDVQILFDEDLKKINGWVG